MFEIPLPYLAIPAIPAIPMTILARPVLKKNLWGTHDDPLPNPYPWATGTGFMGRVRVCTILPAGYLCHSLTAVTWWAHVKNECVCVRVVHNKHTRYSLCNSHAEGTCRWWGGWHRRPGGDRVLKSVFFPFWRRPQPGWLPYLAYLGATGPQLWSCGCAQLHMVRQPGLTGCSPDLCHLV
jgi:hypothetical protein